MASSSRFAAGKNRVINGDDFPPLHGAARSDGNSWQGGRSRASSTGAPNPSDGIRGDSNFTPDAGATSDSRVPEGSHDSSGGTQNWRSLFTSEVRLQFTAPVLIDGMKSVNVEKSILDKGASLWGDCLVGQFFGQPPKLHVIQATADKLWGRYGRIEVISLSNEGFMFRFEDPNTKTWVLEGGPWFIASRPLLLQQWKAGLILDKLSLHKFPLWIALRGVPLELFTPEGLSCIASAVGNPLCLDKATEQRRRVNFARICVEVSNGDVLPDQINVNIETLGKRVINVEYAWKPEFCSLCKYFGHRENNCQAKEEWRPKAGVPNGGSLAPCSQKPSASSNGTTSEEMFKETTSEANNGGSAFRPQKDAESTNDTTANASEADATDVHANDPSYTEPTKQQGSPVGVSPSSFKADMQPTEGISSVLDGSQQGNDEGTTFLPNDANPEGSSSKASQVKQATTPTLDDVSTEEVTADNANGMDTQSVTKNVHTSNSFSVLVNESEVPKSKAQKKRARKQTVKAMESKAQGTKGLWEEFSQS